MGLAPDQKISRIAASLVGGHWLLPLGIAFVAVVVEIGGDTWRVALRYARLEIENGEVWRLVTGHIVHLGWAHLTMNVLALFGIWLLAGRNLSYRDWLLVIVVIIAGIDAGFWWLDLQLVWYVGLSGALHGILVAGLLAGSRARPGETLLLGILLIAKLAYEQRFGALPGSAVTAGGEVVVNAHLYGALAGVLAIALVRVRVALTRPI